MRSMTEQMSAQNKSIRLPQKPTEMTVDEAEKLGSFVERLHERDLVRNHCRLQAVTMRANAEMLAIEEELEKRFPAEKTREQIITPHGIAERKVSNRYHPNAETMDELKELLGAEFEDYFTEKPTYKIATSKAAELAERLGPDAADFVTQSSSFTARKPATEAALNGEAPFAGAIDVVQTITVKVMPPGEEVDV